MFWNTIKNQITSIYRWKCYIQMWGKSESIYIPICKIHSIGEMLQKYEVEKTDWVYIVKYPWNKMFNMDYLWYQYDV